MRKHWWIAFILVLVLALPAVASQAIKISVDGKEVKTDVPAQIIDGRTMVPIRAIAEYFGKTVDYDSNAKTVTITGMTDMEKVSAISTEWAAAGHANLGNPLNYAGGRSGCQPCHSGNGLTNFLSDDKYVPAELIPYWVADANLTDAGKEKKSKDAATDLPRPIDCATCHTGLGQELIDTGVAKAALIPGAKADFNAPGSALCLSCHNGRRDTNDMYQKWSTGAAKPTDYPHHGVGALFLGKGKGGVEYPDGTYNNSIAHQTLGCTSCHMPKTADGYASHSFGMDAAYIDQTCGSCHKGATDFSVGGSLKAELSAMLDELHDAAVAVVPGAKAIGMSRTIFPFVDAEGKRVDLKNVSTEAWVAAYNYYLLKDDLEHFSGGAHNPQYAKSLIRESLKKLK